MSSEPPVSSLETVPPPTADPRVTVRAYRAADRAAVRRLCADTGFLGRPIDPVFEDRELFADLLTRYYTDLEPASALVCERDGKVVGYLIGCRWPLRKTLHLFARIPVHLAHVLCRVWRYSPASRRYLRWVLTRARSETPPSPRGVPHFHVNLLPEARSVAGTRALIDAFLLYLRRCGETSVYGQMVAFDGRRGAALFERYGFEVLNRVEVTKYQGFYDGRVYLYTVRKNLLAYERLEARRRPAGVAPIPRETPCAD